MAHQSHRAIVATECRNVILYPLQGGDLVEQTEIADGVLAEARLQKSCVVYVECRMYYTYYVFRNACSVLA